MLRIGTAYYNGTLYKHRLPPLIEWHNQIRGSKGQSPLRLSFPHFFLRQKEMGPGVIGAGGPLKGLGAESPNSTGGAWAA